MAAVAGGPDAGGMNAAKTPEAVHDVLADSMSRGDSEPGVRDVAALPDPVGETLAEWTKSNGLHIRKLRVPIGVVGIIYESRPNVTVDTAVIALKTGNAIVLRGLLQFMPILRQHQRIDGTIFGLAMNGELEPLREQRSKPLPEMLREQLLLGLS